MRHRHLLVAALLSTTLAACGTAAETAASTEPPSAAPADAAASPVPTDTATPAPDVGGQATADSVGASGNPTAGVSPTPLTSSPTGPSPEPVEAAAPKVTDAAITEAPATSAGVPLDINVHYPVVSGLPDDVARTVNERFMADARAAVAAFRDEADQAGAAHEGPSYFFGVEMHPALVTPQLLSVRFMHQSYTGGAHGTAYVTTRTVDLDSGETRTLTDLFGDGILDRVSSTAITAIQDEYGTGDWAAEGAAPDAALLSRFVLTPDALEVWFDSYQVGPFAIGTPHVTIPYAQLADLVPDDGPVARIAAG